MKALPEIDYDALQWLDEDVDTIPRSCGLAYV